MENVVDIIVKDGKALIVLSRKNRSIMDDIKNQIEKEFKIRKMEFAESSSLFNNNDMFKEFFDGFSLIKKMSLFEEFGLKKFIRFNYSLQTLPPSQKTMFSYELIGRRSQPGVLQRSCGEHLGKGVIVVPEEFKSELEKVFKRWNITYNGEIFYR